MWHKISQKASCLCLLATDTGQSVKWSSPRSYTQVSCHAQLGYLFLFTCLRMNLRFSYNSLFERVSRCYSSSRSTRAQNTTGLTYPGMAGYAFRQSPIICAFLAQCPVCFSESPPSFHHGLQYFLIPSLIGLPLTAHSCTLTATDVLSQVVHCLCSLHKCAMPRSSWTLLADLVGQLRFVKGRN